MSETNLLHYIQSWDFVDQLIEDKTYDIIYADVWHLFPNCSPLQDFTATDKSVLIILSRLTVEQFLDMFDITSVAHITIVNLRVWVAGIGHKFTPEMDDIALMTGHGWTAYEPVSRTDLSMISSQTNTPVYIRITHRYLPDHLDLTARHGMRYHGQLSGSVTYFPASMIEAVGWLDSESQSSQYVLVSDWSGRYLSDEFREVADSGGSSVIIMEQNIQSMSEYIDIIQMLYPKHRIAGVSVGTDLREGEIIVDEHRDEWCGCDALWLGRKLQSS